VKTNVVVTGPEACADPAATPVPSAAHTASAVMRTERVARL
jgi:hypothetical protein